MNEPPPQDPAPTMSGEAKRKVAAVNQDRGGEEQDSIKRPKSGAGASDVKVCTECKAEKNGSQDFSQTQRKKSNGTCRSCIEARQEATRKASTMKKKQNASEKVKKNPTTRVCSDCKVEKERSTGFTKNQLSRKGDGACKSCIDKRLALRKAAQAEAEAKRCVATAPLVPSSFAEKFDTRRLFERHGFADSADDPKRAYIRTFGVGYEEPRELEQYFGRDVYGPTPDIASLEGGYSIVYYSSFRGCPVDEDQGESIGRTARGRAHLMVKDWHGAPALLGGYQIDCMASVGGGGRSHGWGETVASTFIENSIGWDPRGYAGFNIYDKTAYDDEFDELSDDGAKPSSDNEMRLVLDRDLSSVEWWQELGTKDEEEQEGEVGDMYKYCGGTLSVLNKRVALGLSPDRLYENKFCPQGCPKHDLLELVEEKKDGDDYPKNNVERAHELNLERAKKLMEEYSNGSSYITKHLGLSQQVASHIREFVTPPPVFYLEKGDLILRIEESSEPEWDKTVVLRKMTPEEEAKQ